MSWPYGFGFNQPPQYINSFPNYPSGFFGNQIPQNLMLGSMPPPYFNFPANYPLYPPHCSQTIQNSFLHQTQFRMPQNCNLNVFNENCTEKKQNSQKRQDSQEIRFKGKKDKSISNEDEDIKMVRFRRRRTVKKQKNRISHNSSLRNDTKNIPKNYGKAMLSYIQKNSRQVKQILLKFQVDFLQFMMVVKSFKSKINTIHDLRQMWGENEKENQLKKCIRILSYHFMRIKCLAYIFNSRVKNYHTHIKYRKKIMEGIQNPESFTKIKQF